MHTKDKEHKGNETKPTDFGCNPEDFQGMFKKISRCCTGKGGSRDWPDIMKDMMKTCCEPKAENTKTDK